MNDDTPTLFEGPVGAACTPRAFPLSNLLMDRSQFDYEGNWVFCRFDGEAVTAGRFGFGAGRFDGSDYGGKLFDPGLFYHLELMTRCGAVLHLNNRHKIGDVWSDPNRVHVRIASKDRTLLEFEGWPNMRWRVASDDGRAEVDARLTPASVTLLPDTLLPNNRFSMWLAVGRIEVAARFDDETWKLTGSFFYDHPRIRIQPTGAPLFGSYLYMPQRLSDGSHLAAYFTRDRDANRVGGGSYAIHFDAGGEVTLLSEVQQEQIAFDEDEHPRLWRHSFESADMHLDIASTVRADRVLHTWGSDNPPNRRHNRVFPLVFDSEVRVIRDGREANLRGSGMAEFVRHPDLPLGRV